MALRPLAFSVRMRDKGRTLRIHNDPENPRRFVLEDERPNEPIRVRRHESASSAVRDAAVTWRNRLN